MVRCRLSHISKEDSARLTRTTYHADRPHGAVAFLSVLIVLGVIRLVSAQAGFKVIQGDAKTTPTHVEVPGTVVNETRGEAFDVSITVEALGPSGKVLARGICFVSSRVAPGGRADFVAKVPAVPGVNGYRAKVTSFRFLQSPQGP
jgi:hypothetical protein